MYFLLTDTDTTLNADRVWANRKLENNCQISHKSSSRTGTEENLRVEVKADSDVRADDRRGKEETMFWGHDFRSADQRLSAVADNVT